MLFKFATTNIFERRQKQVLMKNIQIQKKQKMETFLRVRGFNKRELAIHDYNNTHELLKPTLKLGADGKSILFLERYGLSSVSSTSKDLAQVAASQSKDEPWVGFKEREAFTGFNEIFWTIPLTQHFTANAPVATQKTITDRIVIPAVRNHLFEGQNVAFMTYGQTGTLKSETCFGVYASNGILEIDRAFLLEPETGEAAGVAQRAMEEIFAEQTRRAKIDNTCQYKVEISFIEIYNEKICDHLNRAKRDEFERPSFDQNCLSHANEGILRDITKKEIKSAEEGINLIARARARFLNNPVRMGFTTARSIGLFQIYLTEIRSSISNTEFSVRCTSFKVIDFAGTELVRSSNVTGTQFNEAVHINTARSAFRKCIDVIIDNQEAAAVATRKNVSPKEKIVPFRESCFTWYIADLFRGEATKCYFMGCISPNEMHAEESLTTLRITNRMKWIGERAPCFSASKTEEFFTKEKLQSSVTVREERLAELKNESSNNENNNNAGGIWQVGLLEGEIKQFNKFLEIIKQCEQR
jgi:hypothetical protein